MGYHRYLVQVRELSHLLAGGVLQLQQVGVVKHGQGAVQVAETMVRVAVEQEHVPEGLEEGYGLGGVKVDCLCLAAHGEQFVRGSRVLDLAYV